MSDIRILPITDDVIEGYHRALDIVARERRYLTMLEAPPISETRKFVAGQIEARNPHVVALAREDVVGWCDLQRSIWPSHAHRGILGMGVVPSHRGRGIGRAMIEIVLAEAWTLGLTRVELNVHADNEAAIALYEKVGFRREGIQRRASLIDGVYRDEIMMANIRDNTDRVAELSSANQSSAC